LITWMCLPPRASRPTLGTLHDHEVPWVS
jgi:hypothetical protein